MELTIPEEVTPFNIKYLTELVQNGRYEYPGANFVFKTIYKDGKPENQKIDLKYRKKSIKLNIGDVVERHSVNGDYVLFNRQPTLHKPSMMGHKLHVLDRDDTFTFRVNASVCAPYNADFDGDEMNIHIAQSVQARNELKRIANVKYQIIGAKNSNPIIGCVQDALSGSYLLTKLDTQIKGSDVSNFLCNTSSETKNEIDKNKMYNGREIFSHIIPKGINNTVIKDDKKVLEIIDGELIIGVLDKTALSKVKNSIIHFIWDKYGPDKTRRFIDDSQRLALAYLNYHGFTFGIKDCINEIKIHNQIKKMINTKLLEYKISLTQYENDTDQINTSIIEANLSSELNAFSSDIGNIIMKSLGPYNNLFVCVDSGSTKANITQMQHIMACVGQKSIEGTRIKKKIENRSLPIFHRDDDSPEARGFIKSSFIDGVNSYEFFYDAMAGREGLIDTAIKSVTWETLIIIIDNNEPKYIEIGKWIDNLLENNKDVQYFIEKQMELLETKNIYIPTMDYQGNVSWGEVSAITRHDPTEILYEIKTSSGRNVTVTDSKSLLVFNNNTNEFKEILTPEIKIGDYVPVTNNLCEPPIIIKEHNNIILNYNNGLLFGEELNNNNIPNFILLAPNEFIDGFVKTFNICNLSKDNLNKLSFLLSRLNLVNNNDNILNDVILDKIIEINKIDPINHPKVYDLTIPSTFNFGLANGLQVRDTAKTGYIQRQLIKGLEDLVIKYDNTNRNAKNVIIQYVYGENGVDQANQTELIIELVSLNNDEIESTYGFTKDEINKLEKEHKIKNIDKLNKSYINKIKYFRDDLRRIQMISNNDYKTLKEKYMLPVNLFRLTQDYSKNKVNTELSPQEILDDLEELFNCKETRLLPGLKDDDINLLKDDRSLKYLFEISIHDYLCPKKCIFKYGLSKKDFKSIINEIKLNYIKALIQPGEMVGIVAAQSIGEPTSQMSTTYTTKIKIIIKNKESGDIILYSNDIGKLIDEIIINNPKLTYGTGHENSVETNINLLNDEYYIIGVDDKEKTHWNKISHVSKHPVNGQIIKIITRSGRSVETTLSHSHLVRRNQHVEPILGSELKVGMRIPVAKHIDNFLIKNEIKINNKILKLDYLFGWFIGAYLATGLINNNTIYISSIYEQFINNTTKFAKLFNMKVNITNYQDEFGSSTSTSFCNELLSTFILDTCYNNTNTCYNNTNTCYNNTNTCYNNIDKKVPNFAFLAPLEFKLGLIQAYIDGNNNLEYNNNKSEIRVSSNSKQLIKDISLLLNYFDIFGLIKTTLVKEIEIYNLIISSNYVILYKNNIGSLLHYYVIKDINKINNFDKIEGLNDIIINCVKKLNLLENQFDVNDKSISRILIQKYLSTFESYKSTLIINELSILKQAVNSNIIWDEITCIDIYTPNQTDYVYDFTVPGNETFMIDNGIIIHNTLNTKHSAGVASKCLTNMGVPRIEELLHYSKDIKTPQTTIYFDKEISNDRSKVNKISSYLTYLNIKELISGAEIYYDINSEILKNDNVSNPFFINNQKVDLSSLPFVFRIKLNMEKMHDKETTLLDIKIKFISHWTKCFTNMKNMKKNEKDIFTKISRCAILSNNNIENQIIHIRFNMSSFNYNLLTDFLKIVLEQITLKGIDNITNSDLIHERKLNFNSDNGNMDVTKEYVVYTGGINMEKIKYIKGINYKLTTCNDVSTIYKLYGIEAARQILINELMLTFTSNGSKSVNHSHMSVLIDMMTHMGLIISIDRHGLDKVDAEPIAKASFEKTMDHFLNAALFNQKDNLQSVSSRIMLGRVIPGGTGAFELMLDTDKLENSEYTKDENGGRITFPALEEEALFKDILKYGFSKDDFFLPI